MIATLTDILYSEKIILDGKRSEYDTVFAVDRANRINSLLERKIFDQEFICELKRRTPYSEIESCYHRFITDIIARVSRFDRIKGKNYHVIVTGEFALKNDTLNDEVFIVLGWPLIKFIDLLNTNALCSRSYDKYFDDSAIILRTYLDKFRNNQNVNIFASIYPLSEFKKEQYQLMMLLQQIQTVFMLSHELGHLLHPEATGLESEIMSDADGIQAVREYTLGDHRLNFYITIAIMMLFSYLTLVDVAMKTTRADKITVRENWMDRYDAIFNFLNALELKDTEMEVVVGYEELCSRLDQLCMQDIDITPR